MELEWITMGDYSVCDDSLESDSQTILYDMFRFSEIAYFSLTASYVDSV